MSPVLSFMPPPLPFMIAYAASPAVVACELLHPHACMLPYVGVLLRAGCNIALYYYSGFCYLLLRRYLDAARAFNNVLNYIARSAFCSSLLWHF